MRTRRTIQKASPGLFDHVDWTAVRARDNTILDRLNAVVDFEAMRERLEAPLVKEDRGNGGRPAFDAVLMFKTLIAQRAYGGISDDAMEFEIRDRESFRRFLGLTIADRMPDSKTIWKYREDWTNAGVFDACCSLFMEMLKQQGIELSPAKIVDATIVEVPIQRNSRDENQHIKDHDEPPPEWNDQPAKMRQKDTDARWTKKGGQKFFGYKLHALVDSMTKLVVGWTVTPANVHDSQEFLDMLVPGEDTVVYADSAYRSEAIIKELEEMGIEGRINERPYRNKPLTEEQKATNRLFSSIRSRGEHVFGVMTNILDLMHLRCIGIKRNAGMLVMGTLVHNMIRGEQIFRLGLKHA